jgi:excisionase family DNA binding protein
MFNSFVLLTVSEAAVMLRYSSSSIYSLIHSGKLKAVKRGRSYFIAKSSIEEYLATTLT